MFLNNAIIQNDNNVIFKKNKKEGFDAFYELPKKNFILKMKSKGNKVIMEIVFIYGYNKYLTF